MTQLNIGTSQLTLANFEHPSFAVLTVPSFDDHPNLAILFLFPGNLRQWPVG